MRFGVVIPSYGAWGDAGMLLDGLAAAEELGFHTAWFGDHIVVPGYATHLSPPRWFDVLSTMFVGAGRTSRIRLGSDVLVLPYRHPVGLSQLVASADQLCGGRLTLGVGVGYISGEFAAVGAPDYADRGAVTDEYLAVLRHVWENDGPLRFDGRWVAFDDVHAGPPPLQRPFPLWVGGNGGRALRRAARYGTGWHPLFPEPEAYRAGRETIETQRTRLGRTDPFTFSYSCAMTAVLATGEQLPAPAGYRSDAPMPAEYRYAPPPPRDADGRPRCVGTAAQVAGDLSTLAAAGVDEVALRFWTGDPDFGVAQFRHQLTRFMTDVAPRVGATQA